MRIIKSFLKTGKNRLLAALFLIALIVGVGAITYGVVQSGHKNPGYYEVELTDEARVAVFDSGVHFLLYVQGDSDAIKQTLQQAGAAYSQSLERCYRLLDPAAEYEGYVNLATLNRHPGEALSVSAELWDVLTDAYAKTQAGQSYSVFDGVLHQEWQTIRYLEAPQEFDPALDPDTAARFAALTAQADAPGACALRFGADKTREVTLELSPDYRTFLTEAEIDAPVLSLGVLKDAYLVQLVAADLVSQGYEDGYFYTDSGIYLLLNREDLSMTLLGCADSAVKPAADLPLAPWSVGCQMTAFPLSQNGYGYYTVQQPGGRVGFRHPWLNRATGLCEDALLSAAVVMPGSRPADALFALLPLTAAPDEAAVQSCLFDLDADFAAYVLQDEPTAWHARGARASAMTLREG